MTLALVLALVLFALTPTGCYLSRAGWEEARILHRRRAIPDVIDDSRTDLATRAKLRLVLDARSFARDSVGLRVKQSFTQYSKLDHDTLVLVLSAAYRDRLVPFTWWFPIVGRVPYKGYFDFAAATRASHEFETRGFDVYLRPSPAFSTLGWFNDPLLSTSLGSDSLEIANTVIHEVTHNTLYAASQTVFNESLANFVGARGAAWFFRVRGQERAAAEVDLRWEDEKLLAVFWSRLFHTMDSAFNAHPTDSLARLAVRDTIFAWARDQLVHAVAPQLRTIPATYAERVRLDNAALLGHRIYLTDVDLFDEVWRREGMDLRRTMSRITALTKQSRKDPYGAVRAWLRGTPPGGPG